MEFWSGCLFLCDTEVTDSHSFIQQFNTLFIAFPTKNRNNLLMALLTVEEHVQDADGTVPGESLTVIGL